MELTEAKEILQYLKEDYIEETKIRKFYTVPIHIDEEDIEAIEVILKELDKKDKVIDRMIETISDEFGNCTYEDRKEWKEFYYKKVEEQEQ